jgi:hypothetical protein
MAGDMAGVMAARPTRPTVTRTLVVLLLVVVAVGWYADHRAAQREAAASAACHRQLLAVTRGYDVRSGSMYSYARPSFVAPVPDSARLLATLMAEPAQRALPSARSARDGCRAVHVLPWHSTNLARRDADLAYADAFVRHLVLVARARPPFRLVDAQLATLRRQARIPAALGS